MSPNGTTRRRFHTLPSVAMILGVPNVGKSSIINMIRATCHHTQSSSTKISPSAATGPFPGLTRNVSGIRVSDSLVLVDTPGVMLPHIEDTQMGLNLVLCGCVREEVVGVELCCEYLLHVLHTRGQLQYVKKFGMIGPAGSIDDLIERWVVCVCVCVFVCVCLDACAYLCGI